MNTSKYDAFAFRLFSLIPSCVHTEHRIIFHQNIYILYVSFENLAKLYCLQKPDPVNQQQQQQILCSVAQLKSYWRLSCDQLRKLFRGFS